MENAAAQILVEAYREQDSQTQRKLDKMIEQNQAIIIQTTKTNGRVLALENRAAKFKKKSNL